MIEERDLDAAVTAGILDAATRERLVAFTREHRRGAARRGRTRNSSAC